MDEVLLERRIRAHKRVLDALLARWGQGRPLAMARKQRGTGDDAERNLSEFIRLDRIRAEATAASAPGSYTPAAVRPAGSPVVIRATRRHGIWRVTCNDRFVGDYMTREPALVAAGVAAEEAAAQGGRVELGVAA